MKRHCATLALALAVALPAPAVAADAPRTDPQVGSPPETLYGIPLERARREAAPEAQRGTAVRSELGVAASERVPGRDATAPGGSGTGRLGLKGLPTDNDERDPPSLDTSNVRLAASAEPAPTTLGTALLVVLTVAIAAAAGLVAARGSREAGG